MGYKVVCFSRAYKKISPLWMESFKDIEICQKIQKDNGKGRRRLHEGLPVGVPDLPAAQRQAPRARTSRTAGTTPPSAVAHVTADSLSPPASPPPQRTGQTVECRRPRTAACGRGRRGQAGGRCGRGSVCTGGWGEGRRIRCRGRGSASSGFATVGGVAGADAGGGRGRRWRLAADARRGSRAGACWLPVQMDVCM
jgi:hypothetical protein